MKRIFSTSVVLSLLAVTMIQAQDISVVHFDSGDKVLIENVASFAADPDVSDIEVVDGYYYRYIQFNVIPDFEEQQAFRSTGIEVIEYLPDNAYLVGIPTEYPTAQFLDYDIRSIVKSDIEDKIDRRLREGLWPDWADAPGGHVKVMIKTYPLVRRETFLNSLDAGGVTYDKADIQFPFVLTEIHPSEIFSIAELAAVQYVALGPDPGEPEDTGGRTLQRANVINNLLPGGLRYDGSGVNVLVRDDGVVGPHIDFEGRLTDVSAGVNGGTHGDGVSGVFVGAGNLDPNNAGGAPGAQLFVDDYVSTFLDNTIDLHQNEGVVITNSSFSNGCNAGYTVTTQTVDQQMIDHPGLMHVFSVGNANGSDCGYGAGTQWGNVTGGHKVGKNVLAVANLNADGTLVGNSSRGPAHDGRIKPDISAHGENQVSTNTNNTYQTFSGSSAAAPTMAATYAQLYQAYRELNSGSDPNAGFLKAVVLNSAFDKGNIGPDYKFGWGTIDALQALQTIDNQYYTNSSIAQGGSNMHTVSVPTGVAEARIMIYWTDPAAATNTTKALVNDLDIFVNDPSITRHDPWVLDPTPNAVTLDLPATRGVDMLNNMEQVSITSPAAGNHTVQVDGTAVPIGSQEYYLVWTFIYDEIKVTYPLGGEGLVAGEVERIHWDAYGTTGTFDIAYSINGGGAWTNIATGVSGDSRLINWTVANAITGGGLIRVTRGAQSDVSDASFSIIGVPQNLAFSNQCKTGATLSWTSVLLADRYVVYQLGDKYMTAIDTVAGLTIDVDQLETGQTHWFSVKAINNSGVVGRRAEAVSYFANPNFINCRNTIDIEKTVNTSQTTAGDVLTYTITFKSFYDTPITNVVVTDVLSPTLTYIPGTLTCGSENNGTITLNHGTVNPDQTISCTFDVRTDPLSFGREIFNDDIESGTANWTVENTTGPWTWAPSTFNANSPTTSWFTPNRGLEENTQSLITVPLVVPESATLSFFHFYNTESGWDGGIVQISTTNGATWTDLGSLMTKNGYNGAIGNSSNTNIANRPAFTGNSGSFAQTSIDLSTYANNTVLIRFLFGEDSSNGAQGWFIDDVLLQSTFSQRNAACVSFDQGSLTCTDTVSTAMLQCDVMTAYLDAMGIASLDTSDLTVSFGSGADTVYFFNESVSCSDAGQSVANAVVAVTAGDTTYCPVLITVLDTLPPSDCQDIIVYLDSLGNYNLTASDTASIITDNCSIDSVSISQVTYTCSDMPSTILNVFARDGSGNVSNCTATATVLDTITPWLTLQGLTIYLDTMGAYTLTSADSTTIMDEITDNCGVDSVGLNQTVFSCGDLSTTSINVTLRDPSGNVGTSPLTVAVLDTISPVMNCTDITVYINEQGIYGLTASDSLEIVSGVSDNCSIDSIGLSRSSFSCADTPEASIMVTAKDGSGNASSCVVEVTVIDTIGQVLSCTDITVDLQVGGQISIIPDDVVLTVPDCALDTQYLNRYDFTCIDVDSTYEILYTAVDSFSNQQTCTVDVSITDNHGYCCPDTLAVDALPIETLDYFGSALITSKGQVADGAPVNLRSTLVRLDTTFHVLPGGVLQVILEDCNN